MIKDKEMTFKRLIYKVKYVIAFIIFLESTNLIYLSSDIIDFLSSLDYLLQIVDDAVLNNIRDTIYNIISKSYLYFTKTYIPL